MFCSCCGSSGTTASSSGSGSTTISSGCSGGTTTSCSGSGGTSTSSGSGTCEKKVTANQKCLDWAAGQCWSDWILKRQRQVKWTVVKVGKLCEGEIYSVRHLGGWYKLG